MSKSLRFVLIGFLLVMIAKDSLFSTTDTVAQSPLLSDKQLAALNDLRYAISRSTDGLTEKHLPDGSVSVDLEGRFQQAIMSRVTAEGKIEFIEPDDFQVVLDSLNITPAQLAQLDALPPPLQKQTVNPSAFIPVRSQNGTTFTIVVVDDPGEGFNDPTPVAPVGGNPGTTLGRQRLEVLKAATAIWATALDSSVEIKIEAQFSPLLCTPDDSLLGLGGSIEVWRNFVPIGNFPGPEFSNTWYPVALANKRNGFDRSPQQNDIFIAFNSDIDNSCLAGQRFYYGLDNSPPVNQANLLSTALHELGHGLGFLNFINRTTGQNFMGSTDIYSVYTLDLTQNKTWAQMGSSPAGDAARMASTINTGNVVWSGSHVTASVSSFLSRTPLLKINSPASIAGTITNVQAAQFSNPITTPRTGNLVLVQDGTPPTSDGCEAITNSSALNGKIVLIDRGLCTFASKVLRAQEAGAIGVVIADNVASELPPMGGSFTPEITIPSLGITLNDGNALKANLSIGVNVTLAPNAQGRFVGADSQGRMLLYTPPQNDEDSSIVHWDRSATPDLLMEPGAGILQSSPLDLTVAQMRDIGWFPDANHDGIPDGEAVYLPIVFK